MHNKVTQQQIDEFIRLFDNDTDAAIQALRVHAQQSMGTCSLLPSNSKETIGKVLISAKELTKEYKIAHQKVVAINGVTLNIREGEFVAIVAPSGGGKSTLLQLLGGLDKPTSGSITVDGINLNSLSDHKLSQFRGQTIGFIFQFFYLQPFLNLERNLEVPGMFARTKHQKRQTRAQELAETVGIADRLKHFPKELSGGQIQRAAIVRALLNNPKVILADEPTGNLDSKNGLAIIDLFEKIRDEFGTTIVVATHDQSVASRADRIISLKDGVVL